MTKKNWVLLAIVAASFVGRAPVYAQGAGHDLQSFVDCLNGRLSGVNPVDVSGAVQCIPDGCKITVTMSQESAQPACFEDLGSPAVKVQLPRILLSCPGPAGNEWKRFRPSFLLCHTNIPERNQGWNRVEIGSDQTPSVVNRKATVSMQTGDVLIPEFQPWVRIITPATAGSCAMCHSRTPGVANDQNLFQPIDNLGTFRSIQLDNDKHDVLLRKLVIDTTEPTKGPELTAAPAAAGITRQSVGANCTILNNQRSNANKNLCTNLKDYQLSRSCGAGVVGVTCGGINGGGIFKYDDLFNGDNSQSVISLDISGQAQKGTTSYRFLDTEGTLSAYNYKTRTLYTSVKIVPVVVIPGAAFDVAGVADAQRSVGGAAPTPIQVQVKISHFRGNLIVKILDMSDNFLAGGTAQAAANVVLTNLAP